MIARSINPIFLFAWLREKTFLRMQKRNRSTAFVNINKVENQAVEKTIASTSAAGDEIPASAMKKTINGSVVTFEGTYLGKPIKVRIYNEPSKQ